MTRGEMLIVSSWAKGAQRLPDGHVRYAEHAHMSFPPLGFEGGGDGLVEMNIEHETVELARVGGSPYYIGVCSCGERFFSRTPPE